MLLEKSEMSFRGGFCVSQVTAFCPEILGNAGQSLLISHCQLLPSKCGSSLYFLSLQDQLMVLDCGAWVCLFPSYLVFAIQLKLVVLEDERLLAGENQGLPLGGQTPANPSPSPCCCGCCERVALGLAWGCGKWVLDWSFLRRAVQPAWWGRQPPDVWA